MTSFISDIQGKFSNPFKLPYLTVAWECKGNDNIKITIKCKSI